MGGVVADPFIVALLPATFAAGVFCGGLLNEWWWRRFVRPRFAEGLAWWLRATLRLGELEADIIAGQIINGLWRQLLEEPCKKA